MPSDRDEYRELGVEVLHGLLKECRKNSDEILIMKTQKQMLSGTVALIVTVVVNLIIKFVFHI